MLYIIYNNLNITFKQKLIITQNRINIKVYKLSNQNLTSMKELTKSKVCCPDKTKIKLENN